jgi:hypothetical protein
MIGMISRRETTTKLARGVSVGSSGRTNTLPLSPDQPLWNVARQRPPFFCADGLVIGQAADKMIVTSRLDDSPFFWGNLFYP